MIKKNLKEKEKVKKTTKTAKKKPKNKYNPQGIDEIIWDYLPEWIKKSKDYHPTIKAMLAIFMSLDVAFNNEKDEDGFFYRSSENLDKDCEMAGLKINSEYRGRVIGLMKRKGLIDHIAGWRNEKKNFGQCSKFKVLVGEEELNQPLQLSDTQNITRENIHLNTNNNKKVNDNINLNHKENVNTNYNTKENFNSNNNEKENINPNFNQNENYQSNYKSKIDLNHNQKEKENLNLKYNLKDNLNPNGNSTTNEDINTLRKDDPFKSKEEFLRYASCFGENRLDKEPYDDLCDPWPDDITDELPF